MSKTLGGMLAITVSFLAGFVMTLILVAGSLVLLDQAIDVAARIWKSSWMGKIRQIMRTPLPRLLRRTV